MKHLALLLFLLMPFAHAFAQDDWPSVDPNHESRQEDSSEEPPSVIHQVLMYLPDRVMDLLDIFRLRVRVGPGVAAGLMATKPISAYLGTHASVYAGLPGPRLQCLPRSPLGLESQNGLRVSLFDATVDGGLDPGYSSTELGADLQLGVAGAAIGIDPVEIADFITGIFFIDLRNDDC